MKFTEFEIDGVNNLVLFRATFDHKHRGNNHRGALDLIALENQVTAGKYPDLDTAIEAELTFVLQHGNQMRIEDENLPDFVAGETLPDCQVSKE